MSRLPGSPIDQEKQPFSGLITLVSCLCQSPTPLAEKIESASAAAATVSRGTSPSAVAKIAANNPDLMAEMTA